jgi:polysaccharide deacetylase family protein (PEP-CTERM system associated)
VLDKLDKASAHATFFATAWVARKCPGVLREVIRRGNEIALAGQRRVSFRNLTRESLRDQVQRDRDTLEHHTLHKVLGFRVTDTLLKPRDLWALRELAALGFHYDSSISPFLRNFQSEPWRRYIHKNSFASGELWEVPLSSESIGGFLLPFAGGNYFRQYPEWLIQKLLTQGSANELHPLVLYFRLWDFDSDQPRLQTGSLIGHFRHYRNGERMIRTMNDLLERFKFGSIAEHLKLPLPATNMELARRPESAKPGANPRVNRPRTPISVIVPCFNEEEGIPFLASNLRGLKADLQAHFETQFILVDDGSGDQTWSLLQKHFADTPDAKLIRHASNQGVSAAIMTGLREAREIACSIDCDCSYDPSELKPMLRLLTADVDLVTASPYHPAGTVLNVPGWRLLLSRASSALYRLVTGQKLHTFTACVRVYRRSAAVDTELRHTGFLGVAELLGKMALERRTIIEHPATLEVRIFGQSKMKIARTIMGHLKLLSELSLIRLRTRRETGNAASLNLGGRDSAGRAETQSVLDPIAEPAEAEVKK